MENFFDLDEFSNKEDNSDFSEEPKSNSPKSHSNPHFSLENDFSQNSDLIFKKEQLSHGQLIISKNNSINGISDNPINVSAFKYKKNNNNYKDLQICEQNIIHDCEIKEINHDNNCSLNEFAEEDNIDVGKFNEIKNPAMDFIFNLDDFQKRSVIRLEQNKNILVCAHTSSGKTLVAEYGIALGKKNKKRVIYTSPIKALSNQKYCEFKKKFKNVGIITGDVNIKPHAQCLIITTEILHKFLYNQSSTLNDVGTVIFDEVHYINDNERGHIWEEILIVLPSHITIIMLSATIPNYFEFACWVGKIKNAKVYIEVTKNRVVPLQHFIYIDPEHIFKVKNKDEVIDNGEIEKAFKYLKQIKAPKNNEKTNLNLNSKNNNLENNEIKNNSDNENYNEIENANNRIEEPLSSNSEMDDNEGNEINDDENNDISDNENDENKKIKGLKFRKKVAKKILEIVKYLLLKKLYPATLFVFNIRKIQDYSLMVIKNNNLPEISKEEKEKINNFFDKAISVIPKEELNISQIQEIRQILQYGIGVHHSGLLPILKEIIEILYFHGLIKILFATTSFSIGLNMPTRTVVFTTLYKYNERKIEMINSSEFLQMSGRAGRRGIDEHGNVFILYSQPQGKHQVEKLKKILSCQGIDLESKFRLSYRIILSFYYRNLKDINDFFKESFHESHNIERKPERIKEINKLKIEIQKKKNFKCLKCGFFCNIEDAPIAKYIRDIDRYDEINNEIYNNEKIIEYLEKNPGVIMQVKNSSNNTINKFHKQDLVILVNVMKLKEEKKLWCFTITSHEEIKRNNNSSNNKDEDSKEKEKEVDKNNMNSLKNKGKYKEYKYKYLLLGFNDIIDIYEKPNVEIKEFYKQDKVKNYFDITEKGYYYFKENNKSLYRTLKFFYRALINFFPKKANNIQVKVKNKKNIQNKNDEVKKIKLLNYQSIIGAENDSKIALKIIEKTELKEKIKVNNCKQCPLYPNHLNSYKEICLIKDRIKEINNEIKKGDKEETYKSFKDRLELLKIFKYIEITKDENDSEIITNSEIIDKDYISYSLTAKGKASMEIITNDSILITELLVSNIFYDSVNDSLLNDVIIVPFLASFVNNDKIQDLKSIIELNDDKINNKQIQYLMGKFHEIYNKLVENENHYKIKESVYNRSFSFRYFYPIYSWMKGENFCDVCTKHQIVEGKLYSNIMRSFYFMEEIANFYRKLGDKKMVDVFLNIKKNLLKGIMSVESLYLKDNIDIDDI